MAPTPTDFSTTLLDELHTVEEASVNLKAIFQTLKNIAGAGEFSDSPEMRHALLFLGRLGIVNCQDLGDYAAAVRLAVATQPEGGQS